MPTIFTHPAVPVALGLALGSKRIPGRLLIAGMVVSILPDLDVVAFRLGIPYASILGHRGFSHSLLFAVAVSTLLSGVVGRRFGVSRWVSLIFLSISMASHALLDACTTGGLGVALWWPWSEQRVFFPETQFIRVSPLGAQFFSWRGLQTLMSELYWVWLPALLCVMAGWWVRRIGASK